MIDNIFTRIYGQCARAYLKSGNYTEGLLKSKKCGYRQKGELVVVLPACHMRRCPNMMLIKNVYNKGGSIVIININYYDIEYLHLILGINATIAYTVEENCKGCKSNICCCKEDKRLGYYGVAKGYNGSINQFYYPIANINNKDLYKKIFQGIGADETTLWLEMNALSTKKPFLENSILNANLYEDLTRLASAQNITFRVESDINLEYYNSALWGGRNNSYAINFSIFPAHSLEDGSDYYYVEQDGIYNFNNNYLGQYKYNYQGALSKIEEYYCSDLVTDCYLNINSNYVDIIRLSPPTTEGQTTITSGISWNLGGSVEVDKDGVNVTVQGGVSVENSREITVNAVSVYNESTDHGSNAKWEYAFKETESKFSFFSYGQVDLISSSSSAHSTFTPLNQWIWRVLPEGRPAGDTIRCTCDLFLVLTSSRGRLTAPGYTEIDKRSRIFSRKFQFDIKQAPKP